MTRRLQWVGNPFPVALNRVHPSAKWKKTNISFSNLCNFRSANWESERAAPETTFFFFFWKDLYVCVCYSGGESDWALKPSLESTINNLNPLGGQAIKTLDMELIHDLLTCCTEENCSFYLPMIHICVLSSLPAASRFLLPLLQVLCCYDSAGVSAKQEGKIMQT